MFRLAVALLLLASCGGRSALLDPRLRDGASDGLDRDASTWRASDLRLDPRCPTAVPQIGDTCSPPELRCNYERCLTVGLSDLTFVCADNLRLGLLDRWDCDPNPSGCPAAPPPDQSPCDLPGGICRWGPGSKAHCWASDLRWRIWRP